MSGNTFKVFWLEERDLPAGSGFSLWGGEHIAAVIAVAIFLTAMVHLFHGKNAGKRVISLRIAALLLPILEAWKLVMLTLSGRMGVGHLPLHLCSMAIFLYPIAALTGNRAVRETLSEIGLVTLLPAAVSAILFPDWTMYPIWNFYSLYSFVWHALQVLFPILCLLQGWCKPDIRHLWKNTLFLVTGAGLIGWLDRRMSCNYWFLQWPVPGTPLQWLYDLSGTGGYHAALLVLATLIQLSVYGVLTLAHRDVPEEAGGPGAP